MKISVSLSQNLWPREFSWSLQWEDLLLPNEKGRNRTHSYQSLVQGVHDFFRHTVIFNATGPSIWSICGQIPHYRNPVTPAVKQCRMAKLPNHSNSNLSMFQAKEFELKVQAVEVRCWKQRGSSKGSDVCPVMLRSLSLVSSDVKSRNPCKFLQWESEWHQAQRNKRVFTKSPTFQTRSKGSQFPNPVVIIIPQIHLREINGLPMKCHFLFIVPSFQVVW
jgi:hypothetical protein